MCTSCKHSWLQLDSFLESTVILPVSLILCNQLKVSSASVTTWCCGAVTGPQVHQWQAHQGLLSSAWQEGGWPQSMQRNSLTHTKPAQKGLCCQLLPLLCIEPSRHQHALQVWHAGLPHEVMSSSAGTSCTWRRADFGSQ